MSNPSGPYGYNGDNEHNPIPQGPSHEGNRSAYSIPPQQGYPQSPYAGPGPVPAQGGTSMMATDPRALNLSYWGIGLAGAGFALGFMTLFLFIPLFLIPFTSIAGMIVSAKSKKYQPNTLATIAFWTNFAGAIISTFCILGILFLLSLLVY